MARNGFMVAAPHSGSGKTLVTLGLLRSFARRGVELAPYKAGPDYIDPAFHRFASGVDCINLDPWAMRPALLSQLAASRSGLCVTEAMMGLYDGAVDGSGSAADLSERLGLPVVFVVDCSRMAQSIAALVSGYRSHRPQLAFAGVILNRIGSARHERMMRDAMAAIDMPVLGAVPALESLALPSRHLGLVQAQEHGAIESFIDAAADLLAANCDLEVLAGLSLDGAPTVDCAPLAPLGQHVAIARDDAFSFIYPHVLDGWRRAGAALSFFSPLADEAPADDADAVFLPGGYPELFAGRLAAASNFKSGMAGAHGRGASIYGECGGYMVLGEGLVDADGTRHTMLGLLGVETSFAERKRHLGYRRLSPCSDWPWADNLTAHEFHYSQAISEKGEPLFVAQDANGVDLGAVGLRNGSVAGSYMHIIDRMDDA